MLEPAYPRCPGDGLLVGTTAWLPVEPTEYASSEREPVGCNRLFCSSCRSWIRGVDDVQFESAAPPREHLETLFLDQRPDKYPGFRRGVLGHRVYLCRCECLEIHGVKQVGGLARTWRCAGHPPHAADEPTAPPATDGELEGLLRATAGGPPPFGDTQPWDFVLRWRHPVLFARVWPLVSKLLVDPDPTIRARSLEFVNGWTVGASMTVSRLIAIVRVFANAYPEPAVRADLARTLVNLSVIVRAYRPTIAAAIMQMLADAPPPNGTAVLLAEYEPEAIIASAHRWSDEDQAVAETTAGAMAMYRRDHLLALLAAFAHRSEAFRADIAAQLARPLVIPDDKLALILAADDLPFPATHPSGHDCLRALGLS